MANILNTYRCDLTIYTYKFIQVLLIVVMWCLLMLILEGSLVRGTINAWIFCIRIVLGVIMSQRESYI